MPDFASDDFVFVGDGAKSWVGRASEICSLEASGNYTRVTLDGAAGSVLIRRSFKECEKKLSGDMFFRVNRGCIVNLDYVKQIRMLDPKRFLFVLENGQQFPVSRRYTVFFRRSLAL